MNLILENKRIGLKQIDWETRFLQSTPGEVIVNSKPREVVQSCWVGAEPGKHGIFPHRLDDLLQQCLEFKKHVTWNLQVMLIVNGMQPLHIAMEDINLVNGRTIR